MKKILLKSTAYILSCLFVLLGICILFIQFLPEQFSKTYQSAIIDKYNALASTSSPKVILVSGSSGGISFDTKQMEEELGMPVVNMALHASFGMKFQSEIIKDNIQKDDIVILAYEYQNWENASVFDAELVVTGLDGHLELYKYISPEHYLDIIKYLPKFIFCKLDSIFIEPYQVNSNWIYCRSAFDETGNIIFPRSGCELPDPYPKTDYVTTTFQKERISPDSIDYVNDFTEFARQKGAQVYISFPPLFEEAIETEGDIDAYQNYLAESLDAEIISSIKEYIYPREYMYDSPYHCNNAGTWERTHSLAWDLRHILGQ